MLDKPKNYTFSLEQITYGTPCKFWCRDIWIFFWPWRNVRLHVFISLQLLLYYYENCQVANGAKRCVASVHKSSPGNLHFSKKQQFYKSRDQFLGNLTAIYTPPFQKHIFFVKTSRLFFFQDNRCETSTQSSFVLLTITQIVRVIYYGS